MKQRQKVVPGAYGHVLEIGIGSGLNMTYYDNNKVASLTGIDPSQELWNKFRGDTSKMGFHFDFVQAYAENLPFDSHCFDSVVVTYSLCTLPDLVSSFNEMRRVIKPNGTLIFCEHGKAPDKAVQRWQNFMNPLWKRLGGGCNLNRDIPHLLVNNGFVINKLDTMYIPGWRPASFNFWGTAKPS